MQLPFTAGQDTPAQTVSTSPRSTNWLALAGAVCVVTGAASGIGAAVAQAAADAGALVALLDFDAAGCAQMAETLCAQGRRAIAITCDTSDSASIEAAAGRVLRELGPCQALVNNAGIMRPGSLDTVSLEDWNQVIGINLTGYLLVARAFAAQMRAAGGGSIVHVASISSLFPQTRSGAYSATKAGVLLLSRQMAVEWGPDGIRSNAICPGMIRTKLSAGFYAEPGFEQRRAAVTASGRIGEPEDIANSVLFLLSARSAYVNGAELSVDGGMGSMLMDLVPRPGYNSAVPAAG
jgi:glucose 1-dehydrogenase